MPAKAAAAENIISLLLGSEGTKWLEATLERTPELLDVISPINTATTLQNKHTYMEFRGTSEDSDHASGDIPHHVSTPTGSLNAKLEFEGPCRRSLSVRRLLERG